MKPWQTAPLAALLLAVTACGSGETPAKAEPKAPTAAPLSVDATCLRMFDPDSPAFTPIVEYMTAAFGDGAPTAGQLGAAKDSLKMLESLVPRAALEVRPDVEVIVAEVNEVMDVYAGGAGDINSEEFKAAAQNLSATCQLIG